MPARWSTSALILAAVVAPGGWAQGNPVSDALRAGTVEHRGALLAAAVAMPAAQYGFRPTPAQRTFGELVLHIRNDSRITCAAIAGTRPAAEGAVRAADAKEILVAALKGSLAFCDSALAQLSDRRLADSVTYYDHPALRVQATVGLLNDWADHYSQQAVYLRLNGILPPTARPRGATPASAPDSAAGVHNGQHDLDFETGTWAIQVRRLLHPLTASTTWVTPQGYLHLVRPVWGGHASLAELEVDSPSPHFAGLMLRLYNPQTRLWSIYWAGSADGALDTPLVGRFRDGRGEFFHQEVFQGKAITVRVVYSDITPTSFRTEQAYSADGGTTWETNLIQTFTRRT